MWSTRTRKQELSALAAAASPSSSKLQSWSTTRPSPIVCPVMRVKKGIWSWATTAVKVQTVTPHYSHPPRHGPTRRQWSKPSDNIFRDAWLWTPGHSGPCCCPPPSAASTRSSQRQWCPSTSHAEIVEAHPTSVSHLERKCSTSIKHSVFSNWSISPAMEMAFDGGAVTLHLPPQNLFHNNRDHGLCINFVKTGNVKFQILFPLSEICA